MVVAGEDGGTRVRLLVKRDFTLQPIEIVAIACAGLAILVVLIATTVHLLRRHSRHSHRLPSHSHSHSRSHSHNSPNHTGHADPSNRHGPERIEISIDPSNPYLLKHSTSHASSKTPPSSVSSRPGQIPGTHGSPGIASGGAGLSGSPLVRSAGTGETVNSPGSGQSPGSRGRLKKNSPGRSPPAPALGPTSTSTATPVPAGEVQVARRDSGDRPSSVVMITYEEGLRRMGIEPPSFSPNQPVSADGRVHPLQTEYDMPSRRVGPGPSPHSQSQSQTEPRTSPQTPAQAYAQSQLLLQSQSQSQSLAQTHPIPTSPPPRFTLATAAPSSSSAEYLSSPRQNLGRAQAHLQRSNTNGSGLQSTWLPSYYRLTGEAPRWGRI